ncbi:MAG: ornithine carbamoyltransferase [Bacteroidetes bacterium]|nr:ornithine carbamoyltransferase [Bacteroidota bacterium]
MKRDFISFSLWTREQLEEVFDLSLRLKARESRPGRPLEGRGAALVFERESLRTRVSFETGVVELGGHPVFLQQEAIGMATRESVHDIARTLSEYVALIIARTIRHQTCVQLAESATVPVINALTDLVHPCQILADAMTLLELGKLSPSTKIVYLGPGNNVANSWLELAEKVPLNLTFSCPAGYEPHPQMLQQAESAALSAINLVADPMAAVRDADIVYTDTWPGSGRSDPAEAGANVFTPYQVNRRLLKSARRECLVMHRLPANRGEEITGEVLDGKQSLVLKQAANRLHVQKAVMTYLLR